MAPDAPPAAAPARDKDKDKDGPPPAKKQRTAHKDLFTKDLAPMMYGFGDQRPAEDSVKVMEELLIDYITEIVTKAHAVSTSTRKIKVEDFKFALRRDAKKLARVDELLFMQEEISRARGRGDDLEQYADAADVKEARETAERERQEAAKKAREDREKEKEKEKAKEGEGKA